MNASHDVSALALIPSALDGWWVIGCEESGTIRDVFNAAGVRTISCDLKPSKTVGPHFQGDIRRIWRLHRWAGGIVHPDCTFLTLAGVRWLFDRSPSTAKVLKGPERWKALFAAAEFFNWLTDTAPQWAVRRWLGLQTNRCEVWRAAGTEAEEQFLFIRNSATSLNTHSTHPLPPPLTLGRSASSLRSGEASQLTLTLNTAAACLSKATTRRSITAPTNSPL